MQYFKPGSVTEFVGDCMPFFHERTFHLYYLLDENHHRARNGYGGHQWAHAASDDLMHWRQYPLAVPVGDEGEYDYLSICTGSTFYHDGVYYAFYATRRLAEDGTCSEHLCRALSHDGIHFTKDPANPIASPGGWYDTRNFRDPVVFRDDATGLFHMLVTACVRTPEMPDRAGCLAHLVSSDLETWQQQPPFIDGLPGRAGFSIAPECADYFRWNDWYYLVYSDPPHATSYRMSRHVLGPWHAPVNDTFDTPMARVFKTAAFTGNRRLAVAFLASLANDRDDGRWEYAGNAVFRELVQHPDGSLGMKWPAEMVPPSGPPIDITTGAMLVSKSQAAQVVATDLPANVHISLMIRPGIDISYFGLRLCGAVDGRSGHQLIFAPRERTVRILSLDNPRTLSHRAITNVTGLDAPFTVDILITGGIVDICVDNRHCLCTRLPELRMDTMVVFNENGDVTFEDIVICPLLDHQ